MNERILMKFFRGADSGPKTNWLHVGSIQILGSRIQSQSGSGNFLKNSLLTIVIPTDSLEYNLRIPSGGMRSTKCFLVFKEWMLVSAPTT